MEKKLRRSPLIGVLILAITYAAVSALSVLAHVGRRYDLSLGARAAETIYAPRTVVNTVATEALREAARVSTPAVYRIDEGRVRELNGQAESFFVTLGTIRSFTGTGGEACEALSSEDKAKYQAMTVPALDEAQLCGVLAAEEGKLTLLENIVLPKLSTALSAGLSEQSAPDVLTAAVREIRATTGLSETLKGVGEAVLNQCMQPTYMEDVEATETARADAAATVEPVTVAKGEPVVMEGAVVTASQMAMLEELDLVRIETEGGSAGKYIGLALCLLFAFVLFLLYLAEYSRDVLTEPKKALLISVLLMLSVAVYLLTVNLSAYIAISMFAILLSAALLSVQVGLAVGFLAGFIQALMIKGGGAPLQFESLALCVSTAASGVIAVFALRETQNRSAYIAAGGIGGGAGALMLLCMALMRGESLVAALGDMGFFLGSSLISAVLVVGTMSIWEELFDAATPARLHELLNTNQPMLRQLMAEAPGTYQHCMNVAALSEAAAQRIGADPLLARVGAIYHDVGKLKRPLYFSENQKKGENIHDTLPPLESALTITAHTRDGVAMLSKSRGKRLRKFPSAVIRIVGEHHGNSLVPYFYHKALQDDPTVSPKDFRYAGPKPTSRESAIVMLADSCEAAVRSLGECTREAREEMVHKVIWGKMNDGENNLLSDVPLTLRQISEIERSFLKTFTGIMHDRIEYPEQAPAGAPLEVTQG